MKLNIRKLETNVFHVLWCNIQSKGIDNHFYLSCHLISNISAVFSITKDNKSFCFVVNSLDK